MGMASEIELTVIDVVDIALISAHWIVVYRILDDAA